jgi:hypothetical protein
VGGARALRGGRGGGGSWVRARDGTAARRSRRGAARRVSARTTCRHQGRCRGSMVAGFPTRFSPQRDSKPTAGPDVGYSGRRPPPAQHP